jgi:prepilin peptidase CpaA
VSTGSVALAMTAVTFVTACAVSDVNARRIPNQLVAAALATALVLNLALFGAAGLGALTAGLLLGGGALFIPFVLGGVGGGDVKMMAAVGALLGPRLAATAVVAGLIFGGIQAVVQLATTSRLREALRRSFLPSTYSSRVRSLQAPGIGGAGAGSVSLPYSIPLGAGTVLALLLHTLGGA